MPPSPSRSRKKIPVAPKPPASAKKKPTNIFLGHKLPVASGKHKVGRQLWPKEDKPQRIVATQMEFSFVVTMRMPQ